jgi:hypothetical protein
MLCQMQTGVMIEIFFGDLVIGQQVPIHKLHIKRHVFDPQGGSIIFYTPFHCITSLDMEDSML